MSGECTDEVHEENALIQYHQYAGVFPLLDGEEFDALVEDIREHGLREPVVLFEGAILDGRNRHRACQAAGVDCRFETYDGTDPLAYVVSLNLKRRHLSESQRSWVAAKIETLRQGRPGKDANWHVSRDDASSMLNVSPRSVARAAEVRDHGVPELQFAVEHGEIAVSTASEIARQPHEQQREIIARGEAEIKRAAAKFREERAAENARKRAEIAAQKAVVPTGKYGCIVIDPPWQMQKIDRDVRPNQVGFDYPTMSEEELAAFRLGDMAADDCHLFLWTTQKFLPMALRLLDPWGFRYCLVMVWHKPGGFQPIGLPQYNCEFAIYARRGAPVFTETTAFPCCFYAPRREHSRKPDEFYDLIRRVTAGPRIDVFSREQRDGFDQHGNEPEKFAEAS